MNTFRSSGMDDPQASLAHTPSLNGHGRAMSSSNRE
jgi:hypothetical protein